MKLLPIIFILFPFLFISCEKSTHYSKSIINDSSHDIWLYNINPLESCGQSTFDSVLLTSASRTFLGNHLHRGKSVDHFSNCDILVCTDTLDTKIATNDSLQLSFIINRNSNWKHEVLVQGGGIMLGECECVLTITDADIH